MDYFGSSVAAVTSSPTALRPEGVADAVEKEPSQPGDRSNDTPNNLGITPKPQQSDLETFGEAPAANGYDIGFFDWTRLSITASLPRHIHFARSIDWASTPLGPIEFWSNDLRAMCNLIMASPHPAAMYWGEELVAIYNEAYIGLAGQKHPQLMGQSYKEAWAEIWDDVKDVFNNARLTGQATMKDDDCLFMKRHGFLEETYFSWSIIPMVGEDGTVMGLYNPAFEKTRRKIAERRMLTLREVGERTATARDVKSFWPQVLTALTENTYDTPFAMLYSVSDDNDSDCSSLHSASLLGNKTCYLEGSLGVPENHPAAPPQMDLKEGHEGFGPVFREVMKTDKPVVLSIGSGDLPAAMMENLDWRGFGDPCRDVVVCPIHPTTGEAILGFLVVGVNPRRPFDDDYNLFIQLLGRQLGTSLASVVLFEEEIRRGQKAAKLAAEDRFNLSEQLAARTQEARDSETRFTRMAEYSPAGLFIADDEGRITYCNDAWYEITRVPKEPLKTDKWIDYVKDEDQWIVQEHWKGLVDHADAINIEFRFKTPWEDRNGNKGDTWVLFSAFPETYEGGELKSVFGSITNISPQKWAEDFQKRKMEEAVELKRQQENFIDITSHEMRNPLSAILQCADEISTTLGEFRDGDTSVIPPGVVADSIDAAQTIALCAQHQKRIVDDVLTLSKLDSAMLMVRSSSLRAKWNTYNA
jgi:PAS domain S-box-containing protein